MILDKAGISLKIQDNLIDWACHYSLVDKLNNGEGEFWIRRNFPGKEPILQDVAKQVGTTYHRPKMCRVIGDYDVETPCLFPCIPP